MTIRSRLISQIDAYLNTHRVSATKLCRMANVDHHVTTTLRKGGSVSLRTIERIEEIVDPQSDAKTQGAAQ